MLDFDFSNSDMSSKVILNAEGLKEVLNDLDTSAEHLEITVDPDEELIRLSTSGVSGRLDIEIPKVSDLVSHFSSSKVINAKYPMNLFKHSLKPLSISEKVSVRINKRDILCLQYMVRCEEHKSFLEFVCIPEEIES